MRDPIDTAASADDEVNVSSERELNYGLVANEYAQTGRADDELLCVQPLLSD